AGPVDGKARPLGERVWFHAGRPHERVGGEPGAVRQSHDAVLRRLEPRLQQDLDAAAAEAFDRVAGEIVADLRQDRTGSLDEYPVHVVRPEVRIEAEC